MPEPLDYRNPKRREPGNPAAAKSPAAGAIPLEFDTLLTRTQNHGAARAIEVQLKREGLDVFRSEEGSQASRWVELRVRATDRERASQIAARTFARRQNLKSFPRQEVTPPPMPGEPDEGSGIIW